MTEPREVLATALSSYLTPEQMKTLIDEVLAITKRISAEFTCKHCGKRQMQWTEVNDAKAVAMALPDLLNQAFGRPSESSVQADPINFIRLTNMSDLDKYKPDPKPEAATVKRKPGRPRKAAA